MEKVPPARAWTAEGPAAAAAAVTARCYGADRRAGWGQIAVQLNRTVTVLTTITITAITTLRGAQIMGVCMVVGVCMGRRNIWKCATWGLLRGAVCRPSACKCLTTAQPCSRTERRCYQGRAAGARCWWAWRSARPPRSRTRRSVSGRGDHAARPTRVTPLTHQATLLTHRVTHSQSGLQKTA